jgi:hypothetical protein
VAIALFSAAMTSSAGHASSKHIAIEVSPDHRFEIIKCKFLQTGHIHCGVETVLEEILIDIFIEIYRLFVKSIIRIVLMVLHYVTSL